MEIRKAERKKAKLRLGIAAPSGAGKTYGALQIAFGLGGKIGMIDTEHGSGDLYAALGDYDIISIASPYEISKYQEALQAFESAGYDTIIIDSLSHAWNGDGGLLDKKEKIAAKTGNSWGAWREITPEQNSLIEAILKSPAHIIATMRAKQEYILETNEKGRQTPRKVGLAPVQREGMEYEFTVMLDIDMHHLASASKDRTQIFGDKHFTLTPDIGKQLLAWLNDGVDPPSVDANILADHLAAIEAAESIETLKAAHKQGYLYVSGFDDAAAMDRLTIAKDKRKEELETTAEAQP